MSQPPSRRFVPTWLLAAILLGPSLAGAIDVWVTRFDDPVPGACLPTDCSLREAIIAANGSATPSYVYLSAGTYELARAGTGEDGSLTGDLDLFNRTIVITGAAANLTTIDANGLDRVFHFFGPAVQALFRDLTITGGSADSSGAGIYISDGSLNIHGSEVRDNSPGLAIVAWEAEVAMSDSTIAGNDRGMLISGGQHGFANITFSGNGGPLTIQGAGLLCQHCTIGDTGTSSPIHVLNDGFLLLRNSALIGECVTTGTGTIVSQDGNLESPGATCELGGPEDEENVAMPGLGILQLNGGTTRTRLPSAVSPLLGNALDANCAVTDQRGAGRPDVSCDTGAVERLYDSPPSATPLFIDGFEQGSPAAWSNY